VPGHRTPVKPRAHEQPQVRRRSRAAQPRAVLEAMHRANNWFVSAHPDPTADIVTNKARPSKSLDLGRRVLPKRSWAYGVEPDATKKQSYYDYAVTWGRAPTHPWTMTYTAAGVMTPRPRITKLAAKLYRSVHIGQAGHRIQENQANIG